MLIFRSAVVSFFFLFLIHTQIQAVPYVTAQVSKGDGIYSFLDRYKVKTPCNIAHFREINNLKKNQGLVAGRDYKLPIYQYAYNGTSIRSTTGINDRPWAETVQAYNEFMFRAGVKPGDYREDRQLWVPYHKLYCKNEEVPLDELPVGVAALNTNSASPVEAVRNVPLRGTYDIFGEKYARVPLESTRLSGKVFYIVGGHGGPDPGAVGTFGSYSLCEDEYAYDVGLRLARNLLAHGATVYLITRDDDDGIREGEILPCDKDETIWVDKSIPVSQSERLFQRSDAVNALYQKNQKQGVKYQRLIVIHVDSDNKTEQIDMFFYHKMDDPESKIFAQGLHRKIRDKYEEYRKGRGYTGTATPRDLHMLRETEPVAVYIELGNIKNRVDQARIVVEGNRQLLANWLFEGLLEDAQ